MARQQAEQVEDAVKAEQVEDAGTYKIEVIEDSATLKVGEIYYEVSGNVTNSLLRKRLIKVI